MSTSNQYEIRATRLPTRAISLRAIERVDLPLIRDWRTQLMAAGVVRQWRPLNEIDQARWLEEVTGDDSKHLMMAILDEEEHIIGVCGLCYVDWPRRRAEASIYIGSEKAREKGHGEAALRNLLGYGFKRLGLRCIWAEIFATNLPSLALFEKVGFVREGILRSRHFHDGKWIDSHSLSILDEEWLKQ